MIYHQRSLLIWLFQALSVLQHLNKRTAIAITIDELRREMFFKDRRDLETIPPTSAALLEHTFRAADIPGHRWNNALSLIT